MEVILKKMIRASGLRTPCFWQVTRRPLAIDSPVTGQLNNQIDTEVRPFNEIPGPLRIPIWGNLLLYKFGVYDWLQYQNVLSLLNQKFGPVVREDLGSSTVIHVFSPDDARVIYASEGRIPFIHPLQETVKLFRNKKNLSPGLGNTNGDEWYRLRKGVRRFMLQPREVIQYLPDVNAATDLFINRILDRRNNSGEVVTLEEDVGKWSFESAGRICFGRSLGCFSQGKEERDVDHIIKCNREVFHLSAHLKFSLPIYKVVPTPRWLKVMKNEETMIKFSEENVHKTLKEIKRFVERGEQVPEHYSFMSHLLASDNLNEKDVVVLAFSMFLDGLSTTVPTTLFNLYNLATHPEVQEQMFEEVSNALPDPNMPITPEILGSLSYVKALVKETFRTIPNGTDISRILEKDHVLSGYLVPAGTHVNINMTPNFKSEKYFSEPDKFKPDRWLRGDENESVHPFVLTPFGHGVRSCAGRRFAEQDLYVVLTKIVRNFKLQYPNREKLSTVFHTLIFPKDPVPVLFLPRN